MNKNIIAYEIITLIGIIDLNTSIIITVNILYVNIHTIIDYIKGTSLNIISQQYFAIFIFSIIFSNTSSIFYINLSLNNNIFEKKKLKFLNV